MNRMNPTPINLMAVAALLQGQATLLEARAHNTRSDVEAFALCAMAGRVRARALDFATRAQIPVSKLN